MEAVHDELGLDRRPWDTIKGCLRAAVAIWRRAVERHRQDLTTLKFARSNLTDMDRVECLLDNVDALIQWLIDILTDDASSNVLM